MKKIHCAKELSVFEKNEILFIELNRPEKHNALNLNMIRGLTALFESIQKKEEEFKSMNLRAILLYGRGKSFCSGGDLEWLRSAIDFNFKQNRDEAYDLFLLFYVASQIQVPLIAKLHGNVMGGGLCLAAVCDFAVAEEKTKFCFSEVKRGLIPAVIAPFVLEKIPLGLAKELMLTGKLFDVSKAKSCHLIQFYGTQDEVKNYLNQTFQCLYQNGIESLQVTKNLLQVIIGRRPHEVQPIVCEMIAKRRLSEEAQEGLKSFLEKRLPRWRVKKRDDPMI